jgi:hypothetical protein
VPGGRSLDAAELRCDVFGASLKVSTASGGPCLLTLSSGAEVAYAVSLGRYRCPEEALVEIEGDDFELLRSYPLEVVGTKEWLRVVRDAEARVQAALGPKLRGASWEAATRQDSCFLQVQLTKSHGAPATLLRVSHDDGGEERGEGAEFVRALAVRYGNDFGLARCRAVAALGGYLAKSRPGPKPSPTCAGLCLTLSELHLDFSR